MAGIINIVTDTAGTVSLVPRIVRIRTMDNYATITSNNYLRQTNNSTYSILSTDVIFVTYGPDSNISFGIFTPNISNGSVTLIPWFDGRLTSITAGTGLSGGTITTSGTIALLSGISLSSSAPAASLIVNSNGFVTSPNNPSFSADLGNSVTNVTGDGTVYTVIFTSPLYNIGSNYNPITGIFTAPATGKYQFYCTVALTNLSSSHTTGDGVYLFTTQKSYFFNILNYFACSQSGFLYLTGSAIANMASGDTAKIITEISGGTKTIGIADLDSTNFTGILIG